MFLLSETEEAQKLRVYKNLGAIEEYSLSEINRMEIIDMADNYYMQIFVGGKQYVRKIVKI